jgi:vacuolar protein sorting-associated protein 13A/C
MYSNIFCNYKTRRKDSKDLESLERKLLYEDIRFYRSVARSRLRKDQALRRKLEAEKKQESSKQGWTSWIWGSSTNTASKEDSAFGQTMTAEQRKELYNVLDFDEKAALAESFQPRRDSMKVRITAKLNKGSFVLRTDPHGDVKEVVSVIFDVFQADFIQRPDNFEASVSLGGLGVFDGTTKNTLHPQIVHVKEKVDASILAVAEVGPTQNSFREPFFYIKFEKNPLDERADNALTVRMRHMEIIYQRGYVEAIYKFFKPPESQLQSVEAFLVSFSTSHFVKLSEVRVSGCC